MSFEDETMLDHPDVHVCTQPRPDTQTFHMLKTCIRTRDACAYVDVIFKTKGA